MNQRVSTALFALSVSVSALLQTASASANNPSYFELEIKQQRIPVKGNSQLESSSFGFRYREYLANNVGFEMTLGRLGLDHENNNNALGYSPAGYHAGLGLSASTAAKKRFQAGADISYSYFNSDHRQIKDKIEISATLAQARLWLALQLTPQLKAYACAFAIGLDGEQTLTGTITTETQLDNQDKTGECGGLRWEIEDNGIVGIEANGGALRGGRIYFGRRFN